MEKIIDYHKLTNWCYFIYYKLYLNFKHTKENIIRYARSASSIRELPSFRNLLKKYLRWYNIVLVRLRIIPRYKHWELFVLRFSVSAILWYRIFIILYFSISLLKKRKPHSYYCFFLFLLFFLTESFFFFFLSFQNIIHQK